MSTDDHQREPVTDDDRFTNPLTAVDHMRSVAREIASVDGYEAAAGAVLNLRREYRVMPLLRKDVPPDRLETWDAVRNEARLLIPLAMGAHGRRKGDIAGFEQRVVTPADQPLTDQPEWAREPTTALQAAALRAPAAAPPPLPSPSAPVDRTPSR